MSTGACHSPGSADRNRGQSSAFLVSPAVAIVYAALGLDMTLRDGRHWTLVDFIDLCARTAALGHWTLDDVIEQLRKQSESGQFDDDCTLVRLTVD